MGTLFLVGIAGLMDGIDQLFKVGAAGQLHNPARATGVFTDSSFARAYRRGSGTGLMVFLAADPAPVLVLASSRTAATFGRRVAVT